MSPIHFRARLDGRTLVLEEPLDLPQGVVLDLWTNPTEEPKPRVPGSAKGLPFYMSEDFDDPLDDFKEYM